MSQININISHQCFHDMYSTPIFEKDEPFLNVLDDTLVSWRHRHVAQYAFLKNEMTSLQVVAGHLHL